MEAYTSLWTSSIRGQTEEARRTTVPQWLKQKPFYRKLIMMKEQKVILQMKGQDKTPVQFSSVAQSCRTLCDPMDCSTPGLPVCHQLPGLAQTHVCRVSAAIQPSYPLSSPSPPTFNLSQHQDLFQWVSSSHQVAKVFEFQLQHQSFQWTPRTDLCLENPMDRGAWRAIVHSVPRVG